MDDNLVTGDFVTVHRDAATASTRGRVFEVTSVPIRAGGEYQVTPLDQGKGVKGLRGAFERATPQQVESAKARAARALPVNLGSTVRFTTPRNDSHKGVMVVINKAGNGKLKLAKLNGGDDRYFTNIDPATIEPAAVSEVDR